MAEENVRLLSNPEKTDLLGYGALYPLPSDPVLQPSQAPTLLGAKSSINLEATGGQDEVMEREVMSILGDSLDPIIPFCEPQIFSSTLPTAQNVLFPVEPGGQKKVVVLGAGDFGLALATRLVQANYSVTVASRNPERARACVTAFGGKMATLEEALGEEGSSKVVVVAIPHEDLQEPDQTSLLSNLLKRKILIDVSNRSPKNMNPRGWSQAEILQMLVPESRVVKAFNVLSAYTLSQGIRGKEVPVCSNDHQARAVVFRMVQDLGFIPVNRGWLVNAREVESLPFTFFPEWKWAFLLSLVVWVFFFILTIMIYDVCPIISTPAGVPKDWTVFNDIFKKNVSKSFASTALILLALCYLPGVLAGYLQLYRGTKYSVFPRWMDRWLKGRKHLGLLMLLYATIHGVCQLGGSEQGDDWRHPTFYACGIYSLSLVVILGLTSLPSVSASLTWREFSIVQSHWGWLAFILAILHTVILRWGSLISFDFKCYVPSISQFVILLPLLTVALKLLLLIPCINRALTNIRGGIVRGSAPPSNA